MNDICRITDEFINDNPWENTCFGNCAPKGLDEISLADLMGEDWQLWVHKISPTKISLELSDDEKILVREDTHIYAWESLVNVARQIIRLNQRIEESK